MKDWKTAALLLGAVRTVHGMVTGKRERERERCRSHEASGARFSLGFRVHVVSGGGNEMQASEERLSAHAQGRRQEAPAQQSGPRPCASRGVGAAVTHAQQSPT